jgi:ParB family transcriptional regulator, chromosome partitioning protein
MTKSKAVLGKGLNALLSRQEPGEVNIRRDSLRSDDGSSEMIARIPVGKIRSNPFQPRLDFDPIALDELKQSILQKGVIQPITVRRMDEGNYELISGERRLRAVIDAGLHEVPAYILNVTSNQEMLELALIENLQREHLNPIEIALSYQRLISELNYTQEEVAQKIGKDRTTVTNFIRLLKLPEEIQHSLRIGEMNMGHARALLGMADQKKQLGLWKKIIAQGLSVRRVEQMVKDAGEKRKKPASIPAESDAHTAPIERKLRQTLGTKVVVRTRANGSGEITIEFYSIDDMERLLDLMDIIDQHNR